MFIKNSKIENYKSFDQPNEIDFECGFNIIVGQNNVGKTAFLEMLTL